MDISKINPRGKLKHLIADDLFAKDVQQVFDAKTGRYIGTLMNGKEILFNEQDEPILKPQEETNRNQLSLF